jgi:hypothetical protein
MGPAAGAHHIGVAQRDSHQFEGHAEQIRRHLGEARLVPLPGRLRADHHLDAVGVDDQVGALLRRADRGFHVVCEAETQKFAAALRLRPPLAKALPIRE